VRATRPRVGDIVRVKYRTGDDSRAQVIEVISGGALVRYLGPNPPWGKRGQRLGVCEHICDLEVVG
jgi:hypothetical protein